MAATRMSSRQHFSQVRSPQDTTHTGCNMLPGCILWLPRKDQIDEHVVNSLNIDNGCFNHPVVILSVDLEGLAATVLTLTSLDGRDLAERHPESYRLRSYHLPIFPSAAHPDNDIQLFLDGNIRLRKKSYIKTKVQILVNMTILVPYNRSGKEYKLKQESYHTLVTYINFAPRTCPPHSLPISRNISDRFPLYGPRSGFYLPAVTHSPSRTIQPTLPHISSTPSYRSASSRFTAAVAPSQLPISTSPYQIPVVRETPQERHIYDVSGRNEREPLLPYSRLPTAPPPSIPESGFSLAKFIVVLLCLGSLGAMTYGGYRLLLLGRFAWEGIRGRWSDFGEMLLRARALQSMRVFFE